jgi:Mrp family chromosome partitioning ATPase
VNAAISDFRRLYEAWRLKQQVSPATHEASTEALRRLEANLLQASKDIGDQLESLTRLKRDVFELREQVAQEKENRDGIKKRIEAQDRLSRVPGRVQVLEPASKRGLPSSDSRPGLAAMGAAAGLGAAFGLVLLVGLCDRRLRGPDDARARAGGDARPILGVLPHFPDDLTDPVQVEQAAHCVHGIRTSLQLWYGWLRKPVYAVTGARAGTGKTTLALALGMSFAAARNRTLLIDFDLVGGGLTRRTAAVKRRRIGQLLRRSGAVNLPQLKEGLRTAAASGSRLGESLVRLGHLADTDLAETLARQNRDALGVLDVLDGEPLARCIARTEVANLSILPVGLARPHQVGTVAPQGIQHLVDVARAAYDVVLIDTGPIPGSLEGAAVAAAADAVLVTVSRGDRRDTLSACMRHLQSVGARVAGVVFNRATARQVGTASHGSPQNATGSSASSGSLVEDHNGNDEAGAAAPGSATATATATATVKASTDAHESWHERFGPFGRAVARSAGQAPCADRRRREGR